MATRRDLWVMHSLDRKGASNCLDCQGSVIPSMFDWAVYCHTRPSTSYQVTGFCQVRNVGDHTTVTYPDSVRLPDIAMLRANGAVYGVITKIWY